MFTVIFVDDDKPLLVSLKRTLRMERSDWQCHYFQRASDALEFMETTHVDVVVSDIRMPGMNGVDFLNKVRERHTSPIRILFSGHMGQDISLKAVNPAHQFIAKPCPVSDLINIIERTFRYTEIFTNPSILNIVNKIESLPVLPDVYLEIEKAVQDDTHSLEDIGDIITRDPGMSASILKTINSPFFGMGRKMDSISHAVTFLGPETIKGLLLCEGIFKQFTSRLKDQYSLSLLWDHSIRVSALAKKIAQHQGLERSEVDAITVAGLLHDLGKLILLDQFPKQYNEVLGLVRENEITARQAELMVFKTNHALVGAYLLGLWGFPEPIVYSVAYHHDPGKSQDSYCHTMPILHAVNTFDHEIYRLSTLTFERTMDMDYMEQCEATCHLDAWKTICCDGLEERKS